MHGPTTVYVFRESAFAPAGDTMFCVGRRTTIEEALGFGQLRAMSAGAAVYTDYIQQIDYIGVWGARNCSRLRTLLRACGLELTISRGRPPATRLRYFAHSRRAGAGSRQLARCALQSRLPKNLCRVSSSSFAFYQQRQNRCIDKELRHDGCRAGNLGCRLPYWLSCRICIDVLGLRSKCCRIVPVRLEQSDRGWLPDDHHGNTHHDWGP